MPNYQIYYNTKCLVGKHFHYVLCLSEAEGMDIKMKRICFFGSSEKIGGTEIYMITVLRLLKDRVRFDYLVRHDYNKIPFEAEIVSCGGKIYREYYSNKERNQKNYISPHEIISHHPEWDGIYLNVQNIHTAYRLLEEAKKVGLTYRIIHSHNNGYMYPIKFKDKLYEIYFQFTRSHIITHYLACSKNAGEWLFGKNININVIPNGVDFALYRKNDTIRKTMRKKYHIADDTILLGFCGRLCRQKNPKMLIDIIAELKKCSIYKLLIVGDGELREELMCHAENCHVEDRILFVGAKNNTNEYYQMMDCFVLPSRFEGFGIVLLEAQAAGLKCYTTDKMVPYETNITGRVTFISSKASADEWAKKIVQEGFDRVDCISILEKSDYSMESMRQKLLKVFDIQGNKIGGV